MKRLDELGVSPAPWEAVVAKDAVIGGGSDRCAWIEDDEGASIGALDRMTVDGMEQMDAERLRANALLMAAAPNLYKALREAVERNCLSCSLGERLTIGDTVKCCKADGSCFVQRWRKALEKAGGTE